MIVGVKVLRRKIKDGIRLARIRVDPKKERVRRNPSQIDNSRLYWLGRISALGNVIIVDRRGEMRDLLRWRENQFDRLVHLAIQRLKRNHAGLADSSRHSAFEPEGFIPIGMQRELGAQLGYAVDPRRLCQTPTFLRRGFYDAMQSRHRNLSYGNGHTPRLAERAQTLPAVFSF